MSFTEQEAQKLKKIATEEWVLPKWLEKMEEYDVVFKKMMEHIKKQDTKISILERKINKLLSKRLK